MYDKDLALDSLCNIQDALQMITERAAVANTPDDFLLSPDGMMRLDAICMNLIALGEAVKGLDKITQGELLPHYSEIYWSGVMKMRDKIAHHYFEMDAEVVFKTLKEDIPTMLPIIQQMIEDISKKNKCKSFSFLLRDEINHSARKINSSCETEISVLRAEWIYPVRWKSWRPQHPYYKPHLRGRVPSCGRRHARFLQLLFQSGSGAYPFVKLLDGRLLLHTAYIHARQFAFAVAAHDKRFLYNIFICLFHVG